MKVKPKNKFFIVFSLFVPWRLINTYYEITHHQLIISRYYAQEHNRVFKRRIDKIDLQKLVWLGFPEERNKKTVLNNQGELILEKTYSIEEPIKTTRRGRYMSQEIHLVLNDGSYIPWNVRGYRRNQIKELSYFIFNNYGIMPSEAIQKEIHF